MFSRKYFVRLPIAILTMALAPSILIAVGVRAQNLPPPGAYKPIPNFTGVGAGVQFRQGINDRLSGVQAIAPTIVSLAFANLPTEQDGGLVYCNNCTKTNPCARSSSSAIGDWTKRNLDLHRSRPDPTANLNFNAHRGRPTSPARLPTATRSCSGSLALSSVGLFRRSCDREAHLIL